MAPTLVASYFVQQNTTAATALTTPSFTPSNGEVIIVKAGTWDTGTSMGTPTGGSQTYTSQIAVAPGGFRPWVGIYTAVISGSPGAMTISSTPSASARYSMTVERWSGAQLAATPATNSGGTVDGGTGAAASSLTTTAPNSVLSWVAADAQSLSPATRAYLNSATDEGVRDGSVGSNGVEYFAYQSVPSAGSTNFGLSAPTGMQWCIAGIEVLDAGGATATVDVGLDVYPWWPGDGPGGAERLLADPRAVDTGGPVTQLADADLPVTASFSAAADRSAPVDAALAVTATLTAAATASRPADASLSVTATLAAAATVTPAGVTATLAVTATLTAAVTYTGVAGAALAVIATTSAAMALTAVTSASLAVTATLTAAATRTALVVASLPVTATLSAGAALSAVVAAALAVTATLTATAVVGTPPVLANAALSVTATLTAAASRTAVATAALSVTVTLTAATARVALTAATLPITATLAAGPGLMQPMTAVLAVLASFVAAAFAQGGIVFRPYIGTTSRPSTGVTGRPFSGITVRP